MKTITKKQWKLHSKSLLLKELVSVFFKKQLLLEKHFKMFARLEFKCVVCKVTAGNVDLCFK